MYRQVHQEYLRLPMLLPVCELFHDSAWNASPIFPPFPALLSLWPRLPGTGWSAAPPAPTSLAGASFNTDHQALPGPLQWQQERAFLTFSQLGICAVLMGCPSASSCSSTSSVGRARNIPCQRTLWPGSLSQNEGLVDRSSVPRQLKYILGTKGFC